MIVKTANMDICMGPRSECIPEVVSNIMLYMLQ